MLHKNSISNASTANIRHSWQTNTSARVNLMNGTFQKSLTNNLITDDFFCPAQSRKVSGVRAQCRAANYICWIYGRL